MKPTAKPVIAPVPPLNIRSGISQQEWQQFIDSWIFLAKVYLSQTDDLFRKSLSPGATCSLLPFLKSYLQEAAGASAADSHLRTCHASGLTGLVFLLLHRSLSLDSPPSSLLQWSQLTSLCKVYNRNAELPRLLQNLWQRHSKDLRTEMLSTSDSLIGHLESNSLEQARQGLRELATILHAWPLAANLFIAGSDFLDTLCIAHVKVSQLMQDEIVAVAFFALLSLAAQNPPNYSLLSDHLYSLKTNAETVSKSAKADGSLLVDLVTNTALLKRLHEIGSLPGATRLQNLLPSLQVFRRSSRRRRRKPPRLKADKGKGRVVESDEIQVHQLSLISQVQDLFPELGSAFIVKLLDEYGESVEQVTAHYLEGSLPSHLREADQSEQMSLPPSHSNDGHIGISPRPTPPLPARRNVFDGDEFDRLEMDPSLVHLGGKAGPDSTDALLADRSVAPDKAAILSALAAFDSDDDERDDTYDVDDVGATVDSMSISNDANALGDKNDEVLLGRFKSDPQVFERDPNTRRGKARANLKQETGMTDEAIEGWAVMLRRDPRRLRRLEGKFGASFSGNQPELRGTAFRAGGDDSTDDTDGGARRGHHTDRGRGGRMRGQRGGRSRGGGPGVAGEGHGEGAQNSNRSRRQGEVNKSSRANHSRKGQRAKKVARAGFGP